MAIFSLFKKAAIVATRNGYLEPISLDWMRQAGIDEFDRRTDLEGIVQAILKLGRTRN